MHIDDVLKIAGALWMISSVLSHVLPAGSAAQRWAARFGLYLGELEKLAPKPPAADGK